MDGYSPMPRVNASMLPSHQGQKVCMLGVAHEPDNNGTSFKLRAADGQDVNIVMQQPLSDYIEGITEVHGEVDAQNNIVCQNYIAFPPEHTQNFDMEQYNKALELVQSHPSHYISRVTEQM